MRRRTFVSGVVGAGVALAGCTGSDEPTDGGSTTSSSTAGETTSAGEVSQDLPAPDALVDQHATVVDDLSFTSEERIEQSSPGSDERVVETHSVRSGDAGTRITSEERTTNSDSSESWTVWLTDNARVIPSEHRYNPDGVTPSFLQREAVLEILNIAAFGNGEAGGGDGSVAVFEASGADEEVASGSSVEFESVDARAAVTDSGFLQALNAEIRFYRGPDAEQTSTVTYDYELSVADDVSVSAPDFVDDAVRIAGSLSDDRSTLVLEHTGGPVVEEGAEVIVEDSENGDVRQPPTFPAAFEPGETAYVYWTAAGDAAITLGEPPSEVARAFALPDGDRDSFVSVQSRSRAGMQFEVRIDRQA